MTYTLIPLKVLCLLTIFCLYGSLSYASVNSKPFVVPELKQWTGKDGNFTPGTNAKIVCTSANPELLRIAQMFADDYQQMFGKTLRGNKTFEWTNEWHYRVWCKRRMYNVRNDETEIRRYGIKILPVD